MDLSQYNVKQLKEIIRNYNLHYHIRDYYRKSRPELEQIINDYMEYVNDKIYNKKRVEVSKPKEKVKKVRAKRTKKDKDVIEPKPEPKQEQKPEPKQEPKPQPKPEPKPEPKQNAMLNELEQKRERVYNIMFKIISSPSKRSRQSLNKEFGLNKDDYELIQKIFDGKNAFDFIPTPLEFLKPMLESIEKRKESAFLEPCCGLGFVIHHVLKVNPKMKITAYELNPEFMKLLQQLYPKEYYPNITFYRKNFLEEEEKGNYSTIFCNPPFTNGTDSRYYINFFFKCNRISLNSDTDYYENHVFFISPPLYPDMKTKSHIDPFDVMTSSYLNKKRIEDILGKEVSNKDFKEFKKERDTSDIYEQLQYFEPNQIDFIEEVQFKAGTNYKANSYLCLNVSQK
jgi:hypothetical protein